MVVKIVPNDKANPPGKLADAELHFTDGELDGLKLIGFAVWERRSGNGRNVTFPARQYRSTVSAAALRCCGPSLMRPGRSACVISCCRCRRGPGGATGRPLRSRSSVLAGTAFQAVPGSRRRPGRTHVYRRASDRRSGRRIPRDSPVDPATLDQRPEDRGREIRQRIVRIRRSVLDRFVASCTIKARASHGRSTKESRLLRRGRSGARRGIAGSLRSATQTAHVCASVPPRARSPAALVRREQTKIENGTWDEQAPKTRHARDRAQAVSRLLEGPASLARPTLSRARVWEAESGPADALGEDHARRRSKTSSCNARRRSLTARSTRTWRS